MSKEDLFGSQDPMASSIPSPLMGTKNVSHSDRRRMQDGAAEKLITFCKKIINYRSCEFYHVLSYEHYQCLFKTWMTSMYLDPNDGKEKMVWEQWTLKEDHPSTWPTLAEPLPLDLPLGSIDPNEFFNKNIRNCVYPTEYTDLPKSFSKDPDAVERDWTNAISKGMCGLVKAVEESAKSANPSGIDCWAGSSQLLQMVAASVRNLITNIEIDLSVKIDMKVSLQESVYDHQEVKQHIWLLPDDIKHKLVNNALEVCVRAKESQEKKTGQRQDKNKAIRQKWQETI
jgi:hypothetical protein